MKRYTFSLTKQNQRQGYLYVAVLLVTLIVSVIGLSAITLARNTLHNSLNNNDAVQAELLARSAIEFELNQIKDNASWRNSNTNNLYSPTTPWTLNGGTFQFKFKDDDGNLTDDSHDNCWLFGKGIKGDAIQVQKVLLIPGSSNPLTCLEVALTSMGEIYVPTSLSISTNQTIHSHGNVSVGFLASVQGNAEAGGTISGSVSGAKTSGATLRHRPERPCLDYYKYQGTWIDLGDIPRNGSDKPEIKNKVISPNSNPFGTETNPEGIYVIDCQSEELFIEDCRIVGTIVLVNAWGNPVIKSQVHWEPAVSNYPAVLSDDQLTLAINQSPLKESDNATNYNPLGTPFEGTEDSDQTDEYPSCIKGIVYAAGVLEIESLTSPKVEGNVVCGWWQQYSSVTINFNSAARDNPPPGFRQGPEMQICPGSWQRALQTD